MKVDSEIPITAVDLLRCQCEKPNGASAFTIGGVPALVRCSNQAVYIAVENQDGADGRRGEMSLCRECSEVMAAQLGAAFATLFWIEGEATL